MCRVYCCTLQCSKSVWPGLLYCSGLGWTTIFLNNTYGFIRHGIRVVILYMPGSREVTAWHNFFGRHDIIRSEYRPGTREAFVQEAASFVSILDPRVGPAGRRHDNNGRPAGSC